MQPGYDRVFPAECQQFFRLFDRLSQWQTFASKDGLIESVGGNIGLSPPERGVMDQQYIVIIFMVLFTGYFKFYAVQLFLPDKALRQIAMNDAVQADNRQFFPFEPADFFCLKINGMPIVHIDIAIVAHILIAKNKQRRLDT